MSIHVGIIQLRIHFPGTKSLKEKRSRLKPLLIRIGKQFNISVAEIDYLDVWQDALIACTMVSNERARVENGLRNVITWVENNWPDIDVIENSSEIIIVS